jgi:hypothetical protein
MSKFVVLECVISSVRLVFFMERVRGYIGGRAHMRGNTRCKNIYIATRWMDISLSCVHVEYKPAWSIKGEYVCL